MSLTPSKSVFRFLTDNCRIFMTLLTVKGYAKGLVCSWIAMVLFYMIYIIWNWERKKSVHPSRLRGVWYISMDKAFNNSNAKTLKSTYCLFPSLYLPASLDQASSNLWSLLQSCHFTHLTLLPSGKSLIRNRGGRIYLLSPWDWEMKQGAFLLEHLGLAKGSTRQDSFSQNRPT